MFYLHIDNGITELDYVGSDHPDLNAAGQEALATLGDMLRDGELDGLLSGKPARLWVTDQPGGEGDTLLTLRVTASAGR